MSFIRSTSTPVVAGYWTGATINAASTSQADVQAAVDSAVHTDIVQIPAGSSTWTSPVLNTKGIWIKGAGIGSTTITDNVTKSSAASSSSLFGCNVASPNAWRISDMSVVGQATDASVNQPGHFNVTGNCKLWNIKNISLTSQQTVFARVFADSWGVISGCSWSGDFKQGLICQHSSWDGVGDYGDNSWATPLYLGTEKAVYVEGCTISGAVDAAFFAGAFDGQAGARIVFRYNALQDQNTTSHGLETGSGRRRSIRSVEFYGNTMDLVLAAYGNYVRGGNWIIFDNTYTGEYNGVIYMTNFRSPDDANQPGYFGVADGTNGWDKNDGTGTPSEQAWLALDQVGAGTSDLLSGATPSAVDLNQQRAPCYSWANDFSGATGGPDYVVSSGVVKANRDYYAQATGVQTSSSSPFNGTSGCGWGTLANRPTTCTTGVGYFATDTNTLYTATATDTWTAHYTPYTYPHPLSEAT